ncbi:hypothetical protein MTBLM5_10270 [Magnetospirillum sp. LM-5]|nr:hypothetical protein MTBLM5_10270 [Magnetospirillum sp. LM-5]
MRRQTNRKVRAGGGLGDATLLIEYGHDVRFHAVQHHPRPSATPAPGAPPKPRSPQAYAVLAARSNQPCRPARENPMGYGKSLETVDLIKPHTMHTIPTITKR